MRLANARRPISAARLRDSIANGLAYTLMRRAVERQVIVPASAVIGATASVAAVSVIVPTCNRPDDLRRCLTALQAQASLCPIEVIVIDNRPGPASPTPAVVRGFPGIRLVEEPKPGLSYARNAGFAVAGNALNDSGAVVTALVFVYLGPFITLLALKDAPA